MISTTVTTTLVVPSPDEAVTISASTPTETTVVAQSGPPVVISTVESPIVTIATDLAQTTIGVIVSDVTVTTLPDDTVIIDVSPSISVNINTQELPVQISTTTPSVVQVSTTDNPTFTVNTIIPPTVVIATLPEVPVSVLVDAEITNTIQAPYEQGPRGPQGLPGPPGNAHQYMASVILPAFSVVRINANGSLGLASCLSFGSVSTVVGILDQSYLATDLTTPLVTGTITNPAWNFIAGQRVFVGDNGQVVQIMPPNSIFQQSLGVMLSSTQLFINILEPILLN